MSSLSSDPSMKVELRFACTDLICKDLTSLSDPCIAVKLKDLSSGRFNEIGRTEKITNCSNPQFSKAIEMVYKFEEMQTLMFEVYDLDNDTATLDDDDFLGKATVNLGQIVSVRTLTTKLSKGKTSKITVTAVEISNSDELRFQARGRGLDNKDFFGKSDPYLTFSKSNGKSWQLIHKTEIIKNDLNPSWKPIGIRVHALCDGDYDRNIMVECYDYDNDGSHDLIGRVETTVNQIISSKFLKLPLINPKKAAKKKNYKNSGEISFENAKIDKVYTFLDYISGGCSINFTCGIDFTGSNGDPRTQQSLHFHTPGTHTEYGKALSAVGFVVQDYDTDKMFPALGFGAKVPFMNNEVSHEFPLNFCMENPYCFGVDGILSAYYNAIHQVKLWGPTNFSPIINHVARFAHQAQLEERASQYFVLLILTDGVVTDMMETVEAIINASHLPMSIIIIGIGNADFGAMEFLDGDDGVLRGQSGRTAHRDIVQFVPYRNYTKASPDHLSRAVLAELPGQVVKYFKLKNLPPCQLPPTNQPPPPQLQS